MSARGPLPANNSRIARLRAIAPNDATDISAWIVRELPVPDELSASLPALLSRLINEEVLRGELVEYVEGARSPALLAAFGLSGFISNTIAGEYLASPYPHLELELLDRAQESDRPDALLDYAAVARANAGEGLTLFPLMWLQRANDPADPETRALLAACQQSFLRIHRGYRLARILKETTADRRSAYLAGGFRERHRLPIGTPHRFSGGKLEQEHVVFEVSRFDIENVLPGAAVSHLFEYRPPRCGFSRLQQQILVRAVDHHQTDAEIAAALGIAPSAVALRWRSIYERVATNIPSVFEADLKSPGHGRGKEKRRCVVVFVNDYPEEMRP